MQLLCRQPFGSSLVTSHHIWKRLMRFNSSWLVILKWRCLCLATVLVYISQGEGGNCCLLEVIVVFTFSIQALCWMTETAVHNSWPKTQAYFSPSFLHLQPCASSTFLKGHPSTRCLNYRSNVFPIPGNNYITVNFWHFLPYQTFVMFSDLKAHVTSCEGNTI